MSRSLIVLTTLLLIASCAPKKKSLFSVEDNSNYTGAYVPKLNSKSNKKTNNESKKVVLESEHKQPIEYSISPSFVNDFSIEDVPNTLKEYSNVLPEKKSPLSQKQRSSVKKEYLAYISSFDMIQDYKNEIKNNEAAKLFSTKIESFESYFFSKKPPFQNCNQYSASDLNQVSFKSILKNSDCYYAKVVVGSEIYSFFGTINIGNLNKNDLSSLSTFTPSVNNSYKFSGKCLNIHCSKRAFKIVDAKKNDNFTYLLFSSAYSSLKVRNKQQNKNTQNFQQNQLVWSTHWEAPYGRSQFKDFIYEKLENNNISLIFTINYDSILPGANQLYVKPEYYNANVDNAPIAAYVVGNSGNEGKRLLRFQYADVDDSLSFKEQVNRIQNLESANESDRDYEENQTIESEIEDHEEETNANNDSVEDNDTEIDNSSDENPSSEYEESIQKPAESKEIDNLLEKTVYIELTDPEKKNVDTVKEEKKTQGKNNHSLIKSSSIRSKKLQPQFDYAYQTPLVKFYTKVLTTDLNRNEKSTLAKKYNETKIDSRASLDRFQRFQIFSYPFHKSIELAFDFHNIPIDYFFVYYLESEYFTNLNSPYIIQKAKTSTAKGPGQFVYNTGVEYDLISKTVSKKQFLQKCKYVKVKSKDKSYCYENDLRYYFTPNICATASYMSNLVKNYYSDNSPLAILAYYLGQGNVNKSLKRFKKKKEYKEVLKLLKGTDLNFNEVVKHNILSTNKQLDKLKYAALTLAMGYINNNINDFEDSMPHKNKLKNKVPSSFTKKNIWGKNKKCVDTINRAYNL